MLDKDTFRRAIAALDMTAKRYLAMILLPTILGSAALGYALVAFFPAIFSGLFVAIPYGIPVVVTGFVFLYPLLLAQQRGHEIDHNMHYFITHLGTLATSRIPPVELFEKIGGKQVQYGPLADECEKVAMLVKDWNMSLAEACRFVAKRTPSELFSDFLERFAFGVESGTEMEAFLSGEQEVVMADYETLYRETIQGIDDLKSLYNGAMMSVIFLIMLSLMTIILMDIPAVLLMLGVAGITLVLHGGFLLLAKMRTPPDPIWASNTDESPLLPKLKLSLPLAVVGVCAAGALVFTFTDWPTPIRLAITMTPLIVPGWLATRVETTVKRRDDNYPGFMRSLGSSTAARGGDERAVLNHLRHHDFGPLSDNIRDLFARLQMRVDDEKSWEYFTSEAGSRLVERFTQMYDEAVEEGGKPDDIGRIISENMVEIIGLRKLRYQQASTFRGVVFGIAVGAAFSLFIGLGVLHMLTGLFEGIGNEIEGAPVGIPTLVHVGGVNMPLMRGIGLGLLFLNAALASVLIRVVDGGTHARDLQDFTLLLWVSNVTAWGSWKMVTAFGNVGPG